MLVYPQVTLPKATFQVQRVNYEEKNVQSDYMLSYDDMLSLLDEIESGELEKLLAPPPTKLFVRRAKIFGAIALAIGLTLVVLIILAEVFGYR